MEKAVMIQKAEKAEKIAKKKTKVKLNRAISSQKLRKGARKVNVATKKCNTKVETIKIKKVKKNEKR